jgi:hypothetical protein
MRFYLHIHTDKNNNRCPFVWVGDNDADALDRFRKYCAAFGHDPDLHEEVIDIHEAMEASKPELTQALFGDQSADSQIILYCYEEGGRTKVEFPTYFSVNRMNMDLTALTVAAHAGARKTHFMTDQKDQLTGLLLNHGPRMGWDASLSNETELA